MGHKVEVETQNIWLQQAIKSPALFDLDSIIIVHTVLKRVECLARYTCTRKSVIDQRVSKYGVHFNHVE